MVPSQRLVLEATVLEMYRDLGVLGLGALTYTGYVLSGTDVGTFFAVPLVVAGALLFPVWAATGLVAIGHALTHWAGAESLSTAVVGAGGSTRVALEGGLKSEDDRVVPPANRV
ncbi:hypothetical protein ACYJ1Y_10035 [Natrialbaceae archaeon A-gly3]